MSSLCVCIYMYIRNIIISRYYYTEYFLDTTLSFIFQYDLIHLPYRQSVTVLERFYRDVCRDREEAGKQENNRLFSYFAQRANAPFFTVQNYINIIYFNF